MVLEPCGVPWRSPKGSPISRHPNVANKNNHKVALDQGQNRARTLCFPCYLYPPIDSLVMTLSLDVELCRLLGNSSIMTFLFLLFWITICHPSSTFWSESGSFKLGLSFKPNFGLLPSLEMELSPFKFHLVLGKYMCCFSFYVTFPSFLHNAENT